MGNIRFDGNLGDARGPAGRAAPWRGDWDLVQDKGMGKASGRQGRRAVAAEEPAQSLQAAQTERGWGLCSSAPTYSAASSDTGFRPATSSSR